MTEVSNIMLPIELVSKIMLFHSNIRFDKNELIDFVADWNEMKILDDWGIHEDDGDFTDEMQERMDELLEKPLINKFYLSRSLDLSYEEVYFGPPIPP